MCISVFIFSSQSIWAFSQIDSPNSSTHALPKVAVVFSGGAARGLCHLGVLSVLEEYKIPIDLIVGVSMGSIVGGYYAYGYSIDDMLKKANRFSLISLIDFEHPRDGFLSGNKLETLFKHDIDNIKIEDLSIPLVIISTDLNTGDQVVFDRGPLYMAMRASSAVPGLFEPVYYRGKMLIDGGVLNRTPVNIAKKMGADIIIVSNVAVLTTINKNKIPDKLYQVALKYVSENKKKLLFKKSLKKNTLISMLAKTLLIIEKNQKINQEDLERVKPDFIIKPIHNEIGPFDFYRVNEGYNLGRKAALEIIDKIVGKVYCDESSCSVFVK